jgi:hypothetical protein
LLFRAHGKRVILSASCQPDVPKSRNEKAALLPSAGDHSHQGD